ncbi:MBL fold metallo-hydrolase [Saccharomonospora sp. CUA-673]|uniref:MBL fold metallo-hydrolase n=1 Tax=Saccharomonospora sp. CUA-673 TaxID=1904969 RepID=UPI0009600C6A|nr:MBL fold metallo-hydrolase [Saccharomonospora sp. CUA-673]OLT49213.1 MBL fold metallo-hydrolase [Saccharomonospora sp. CUA-673]
MTTEPALDLPVCLACGTQYAAPRADCPICEDERQYVPRSGQQWTSLRELRAGDYTVAVEQEGPGVYGVGTRERFAIGQRALLVRAASGNVLWDCVTYLDDRLVEHLVDLGGITAIAISHPHYYTTMVDWADTFGVPLYLHERDRQWVGRPSERIRFWSGDTFALAEDLTLVNPGVHFAGGTVLHWRDGAGGKGALCTGDIVQVVPNRELVAFMYSYPNFLPERPSVVRRAADMLAGLAFDDLYGAWWNATIIGGAERVVQHAAKRYLELTVG